MIQYNEHIPPSLHACIAPSAAPNSLRVLEATYSSITIQWMEVVCIHRNGNITGYSVRYDGGVSEHTIHVPFSNITTTTITGLMFSTEYSIEIAAIGSGDAGVYSTFPIFAVTKGKLIDLLHTIFDNIIL